MNGARSARLVGVSRRAEPAVGTLLLLGGRSEIGLEVATRLAPGRTVVLAARRSADLAAQIRRVQQAGAEAVRTIEFDADAMDTHAELLREVSEQHGPIGIVVLAFGILGDQARAENDAQHALDVITTDFLAQVSVLTHASKLLREQGSGDLVVFSSVAGVRVRRANYVYGSAKAGLDGFASGLGDALHGSGVHLLLARPGFVIGSMTEGMTPAPMSSTPDQVADVVVAALRRRRTKVWIPGTLRPVFFAMRLLPQWLWRRMPR
ncbi:SDR family NAD(P)-dependent oxidoreductase [Rhodococcus sp. KRD162]|uniref:SDR family NAD(P)-dependent oxidoreductase n=1 Tax=Rhodococcus sp. KRD162 TaxID=2729725 RepID=UPI0019D071D5|nr:SDR family NAD(P)-dependent oxidoreductase [Rhodococcus sp. KRD162]